MIESGLVLPCYNVLNPGGGSLSQTKDMDCFKLYLSDIGLFITMLFNDSQNGIADIYRKLLSDTLPADLGYLYENGYVKIKADIYDHFFAKKFVIMLGANTIAPNIIVIADIFTYK